MLSMLEIKDSPFNEQQLVSLQQSIGGLNPAQSQWLSGYLAGRLANGLQPSLATEAVPGDSLTVLYGSETGNGESIASDLMSQGKQQGIDIKMQALEDFRPKALSKLKNVIFVVSTHGEGEPPAGSEDLFEYLEGKQAAQLPDLNYRILALGDRSYALFCEAGRILDQRLQALGAKSFGPRLECDVDYHKTAAEFGKDVIDFAQQHLRKMESVNDSDANAGTHLSLVPSQSPWNRLHPFKAEVERLQKITGDDSDKDVYHVELSLEHSGLSYQAGDALGVWASNDSELIKQLLDQLQINPASVVQVNDQSLSISEALGTHLEITRLTVDTVKRYSQAGGLTALKNLYSNLTPQKQQQFVQERQLADLADEYPARFEPQALVDLLRPLTPRSYSIASSQNTVDEEVHLTVATLHSDAIGVQRQGVASGFLNHRLKPGKKVNVFIEPNTRFRLPENHTAPIIMIGAGTGIAPYRAFMQELENRKDKTDAWLIFGNPHLRTDFLYQREWLRWRDGGQLQRIDTAWSRDQAEKRYVQNVVREQAEDINSWLQRGAYIYLCGSLQMGRAVEQTLQDVLQQQRGLNTEAAKDLLSTLRREKRIQKDLY